MNISSNCKNTHLWGIMSLGPTLRLLLLILEMSAGLKHKSSLFIVKSPTLLLLDDYKQKLKKRSFRVDKNIISVSALTQYTSWNGSKCSQNVSTEGLGSFKKQLFPWRQDICFGYLNKGHHYNVTWTISMYKMNKNTPRKLCLLFCWFVLLSKWLNK